MARRGDDDGEWVFEGQCGDCGWIEVAPDGLSYGERSAFVRDHLRCSGIFMGHPKNRCGWLLTWVQVWMPREKAATLARTKP